MNIKNTQLQVNSQKLMGLKTLLEQRKGSLAAVLPNHLTPERLIKISLVAASRNPMLLQCTPESIFSALMDASQVGLEPFTGQNLSYIIPYKNGHTGVMEAKFMPSYRGLLELMRRSGQIKSVDADIVHEKDIFEVEKGLNPKLKHVPNYSCKDRGKAVLVYAIAIFKDSGFQFVIMTMEDIDKVRAQSKAKNSGPWVDWWDEMAKKSALRLLSKTCPMGVEAAQAIAKDNALEGGYDIDYINPDDPIEIDETVKLDKSSTLVEQLAGVKGSEQV